MTSRGRIGLFDEMKKIKQSFQDNLFNKSC